MRLVREPSHRSLEWRVALAWMLLIIAVLTTPAVSSREPHLLRHSIASHISNVSLLTLCFVLTIWPIVRGGTALRVIALICAALAACLLADWLVLLITAPTSLTRPLFG